jgi:E3 ubiquitin-protein ligase RNF144
MLAKLMEPAATKVAVELQLADINDQLDGLYDEPEITDHDRARLQLLRADLHQQLQILEQHLHTLNVMRGEHEDRVAIAKFLEEEQQAISDHRFAMHLAGLTVTDTATRTLSDHEASIIANLKDNYDEQWESTKKAYAAALEQEMANRVPPDCPLVSQCREAEVDQKSTTLESKTMIKCCACMEAFGNEDALTLDCKPEAHSYCRDCLIDMFANAMVDPTLFPPRCCKLPFPLETCRAMLPQELVKDFDLKVEELATPNPTFCANAECSKFIRPKEITADIASCLFCQEKTCTRCKSSEHAGLCPTDPHVQLLMDLAKRSKWQQCTKCKNMVQLEEGCFHMTYVFHSFSILHVLMTHTDAVASTNSATSVVCSGRPVFVLSGMSTI